MSLDELPQLPTIAQIAPVIGVEKSTLYAWIKAGAFPEAIVRNINGTMRVSKLDLIDWLKGQAA